MDDRSTHRMDPTKGEKGRKTGMKQSESYLGDGVYFRSDGHDVTLTTENGISVSNEIILEPKVCEKLIRSLGHVFGKDNILKVLG